MVSLESAPSPLSVAMLEDQRVLRDSMAELLASHGMSVSFSVGDVDSFRREMERGSPSVALIDLRLAGDPEESPGRGWEAVDLIRQWYPGVKVIVLSASQKLEIIDRCRQEGVGGFLHKDTLSGVALVDAIHRVSQGERIFPLAEMWSLARGGGNTASPNASARSPLTAREMDVLRQVAAGNDNLKISALLDISERTVRAHVSSLYRKLGSENRTQLALEARRMGVIPREP